MQLGKVFDGPWVEHTEPIDSQIRNAMAQAGINPPSTITIDGNIHRFSTAPHGLDDAGWMVFYADGIIAGSFGDWRTGVQCNFVEKRTNPLTASELAEANRRIAEAKIRHDEERTRRNNLAAGAVAKIWSDAMPADAGHAYLVKKRIGPNGARVVGDGRLVVPLFDPDGSISSVQYINQDGEKRYHPGGATKGKYHTIGEIKDKVYIAEGFATGATVYEATGTATVIAYSAGNLEPTTSAIREKHPTVKIIIVADNDESGVGKNYADQASAKHGATVIMPPDRGDANDYMIAGGDLKLLLNPPVKQWLNSIEDWCSQPAPIKWHVRGWVQENALIMAHGPSGGGKTFVVLDMMLSIASGLPDWQGNKIKPGNIVYLAGEGHHGLRSRVAVWMQEHKQKPKNMWVSNSAVDLNTPQGTQSTIEHIKSLQNDPKIVVVDTLHRFMDGDENSAQDTKTMIDACALIQAEFGCSVILVHHTGVAENAQGRGRGSSSWRGALENEISIRESEGVITIEAIKIKDAEKPMPITVELKKTDIEGWIDEDGEQVNSAIVVKCDGQTKEKPQSKKIQEVSKIIEKAWYHTGMELSDDEPYITISGFIKWFEECTDKTSGTIKNEMKPSVEGRFINTALKEGLIDKKLHGYVVKDDSLVSRLIMSTKV